MNLARTLFAKVCTQAFLLTAFALAMLWNSAAYAQPAPTAAPIQPQATPPTSSQITPPPQASQLGDQNTVPQKCDGFLPPGVTYTPGWVHSTLVSYRLTATGDIRDVALYRSSGNSDLDKAALACIDNRRTAPVMVAGTPADITWVGGVSWASRWHQFVPTDLDGEPNLCDFSKWSLREVRPPVQGDTKVSFRITTDGSVKDVVVTQSAGDRALDKASLQCVKSFRFFPAMHNGHPVELDKVDVFHWRLR